MDSIVKPPPAPPPDATFRTWAGVPTHGDYTVLISNVHDGDTVTGCIMVPIKIRLFGINAPELATPDGKLSQQFVAGLVAGKTLSVRFYGTEKFGRTLGDFTWQGGWLSDTIVSAGFAVPYDGHGPRP